MNFSPIQIRIFKTPENPQFSQVMPKIQGYTQPTSDCFCKNTIETEQTKEIAKIVQTPEQKALEKIYNETYEEVLADIAQTNPIINQINLQKPTLIFTDFEKDTKGAAYNFEHNEIRISNSIFEKMYLICVKDENGNIRVSNFVNENQLEAEQKELKDLEIENYEIKELTKDEKEIYCKAIIAHELRHFTQEHIMAATQYIGDLHDKQAEDKVNSFKKLKEGYIEACKKEGKAPNPQILSKNSELYKGYKQNKIFPRNMTFKFSSNKNDSRYWSVEEDFWNRTNYYLSLESGNNYFPRPTEIDAFNYELEYFNKIRKNYNLSTDFISEFTKLQKENIESGLNSLKKVGFVFKSE